MTKLVYKRYKGSSGILGIDLHNCYTIISIKTRNKDKNIYNAELRLKENTSEKWDLIEKAGNLVFDTDGRHIDSAVLRQVSTYFQEGYFDYYIKKNIYETECFSRGNELYGEKTASKKHMAAYEKR